MYPNIPNELIQGRISDLNHEAAQNRLVKLAMADRPPRRLSLPRLTLFQQRRPAAQTAVSRLHPTSEQAIVSG